MRAKGAVKKNPKKQKRLHEELLARDGTKRNRSR